MDTDVCSRPSCKGCKAFKMSYAKSNGAQDRVAMDSLSCGSGDRDVAGPLDAPAVRHQRALKCGSIVGISLFAVLRIAHPQREPS